MTATRPPEPQILTEPSSWARLTIAAVARLSRTPRSVAVVIALAMLSSTVSTPLVLAILSGANHPTWSVVSIGGGNIAFAMAGLVTIAFLRDTIPA